MKNILVLLATYNGEKFLKDQLDSIKNQIKHNIKILISDDQSSDNTCMIIDNFQKENPNLIEKFLVHKKHGSASKNFLFLINQSSEEFDYYCFADQDDFWLENKIDVAITNLEKGFDVYGSKTMLTDENLNIYGQSMFFKKKPSFKNAIVQNIAGGNTMVMNKKFFLDFKSHKIMDAPSHDWLVYIYCMFAGYNYFYDCQPYILYRQHGKNDIGSNAGFKNQIIRILKTLGGQYKQWNDRHEKIINKLMNEGTENNKKIFLEFQKFRRNKIKSLVEILQNRLPIERQTSLGNLMLKVALMLGKL